MKALDPRQQLHWRVRLLPVAGDVLVGLGQGRVDVDGAENLVQTDALFHRQHKFGDQVAGMFADDSDAENPVLARHGQNLDEAVRFAVCDGAVEIVGRYDTADFTDSLTGGEGDTWLLGINWYPTNNTRVSAHWSAWSVDNRTGTFTGEDNGNTATVRVQTAF